MSEHQPLTPETIASLPSPSDPQISPDGARVAWAVAPSGQKEKHADRGVWVADLAQADGTPRARRWTHGGDDSTPRWSPDGTRIAFLSDRAERGTHGLYVIELAGGEARALVARKRSVGSFAWAPDGRSIAFLAPDEPTEDEERREKERDDADVFGERTTPARVWTIAVPGVDDATEPADAELLWAPEGRHVTELAWSPDGSRLAVLDNAGTLAQYMTTTQVSVITPAGAGMPLANVPMCRSLAWCGDTTLVLAGWHDHTAQASATLWAVDVLDEAGRRAEPRVIGTTSDEPRCTIDVAPVAGGDRVVAVVVDGLDTRLELLDPSDGTRSVVTDLGGECGGLTAVAVDGGQALALVHHGDGAVGRVLAGPPDGLRLVHDHADGVAQSTPLASTVLSVPESFHATAPDGTSLDAVVLRPVGSEAGEGPWPTAVLLHGGPYYRSGLDSHTHPLDWGQLLASHGYAVVMPNYRGGMGHGQDFAVQARGTMGSVEWDDVTAVVDAAVEAQIADPDRLGIGGWSQGGFLTAWAVTGAPQPDRFKVGVMGAGVSDWSMMAATSDLPDFEAALGGSRPWDGIGPHHAAVGSPLSHAARRTTPLLILHGAEDQRVPLSQATAFHRALAGQDAPLALVTYPREPHGLKEWRHQVDAQRRVLEWFDRYLR